MIICEDQSKEMEAQNCCIKWTKQLTHLQSTLTDYMEDQILCDVTLATTSEVFNAHQLVLSACSPYFKNIFTNLPTHKHPVIFLRDVSPLEIKTLLDYMYKGQAIVPTNLLPTLLKTCKILQIQGLCNDSDENYSQSTNENANCNNTVATNNCTGKENHCRQHVQLTSKNVEVTDHMQSEYKSKNKYKRKLCDLENNLHPLQEENKDTIQDETLNEQPDNLNQEKRQKSKRNQQCQTQPTICVTPDKILSPTITRNCTEGTKKATNNDICSNTTPERGSILCSPSYSQDSFVFNYDDHPEPLDVKNTEKTSVSTQSIIIEENEPSVINISDEENEDDDDDFQISTYKRDYAPKNRDKSGSMIVQNDVNTQKNCSENHLEPDLSPKCTHNTESSVSSDSEIIVRPTNKRISNSSAGHGSDAESNDSKAPCSNDNLVEVLSETENLKAESLKRVLGMKIIIHKLNEENDEQESLNQPGTSKAIASKSVKEYESMILTNIEESFHKSTDKPGTSKSAFNKNKSACVQLLQDQNKSLENLEEEKVVHKKHVIIKTSDLKTRFRHCTPQGTGSDPHVVNQEDQGTNETLTNIPNKNGQIFCSFCKKWIGKNTFQQHVRNQHPNVECETKNRRAS